ncbi:MAG: hypothetical protein A2133_01130 [Actinobacteria bacterium RBG_16_64_13]|nr:MAG: hypothetical protein A2133_01130 [Actinobacteria bacterium RBG_16_64_13]
MPLKPVVATVAAEKRSRRLLAGVCIGAVVVLTLIASLVSLAIAVTPSFPDVSVGHPYYTAITDLASREIISGFPNGYFGPNDDVTRQQFAKMIVLTGGYPVSEADVCPFTDVQKSGPTTLYPDNYIAVCASHGITAGKTATTFDPSSYITRYQVISMVVRAADDIRPGLLTAPPAGWTGGAGWENNGTHGANAARAEYNGLLSGLNISLLDPLGNMTRGEVAQVLHNLINKLTPPTTTTTAATTTTTLVTTTTTSSTTTSTTTTIVHYEDLGGALTSGPAAASWSAGRLDVFARGTAGQLMHIAYDGEWNTWQDLGGELATGSRPAAVGQAAHPIDVFVRGTDNALWYKFYGGSAWSPWTSMGGTLASSPAVISMGGGSLIVFARGTDGALWEMDYNGLIWLPWSTLGGVVKADSDPAAVSWGPGRVDVFVRGADDALWHRAWGGAYWTPWESLGGALTSSPTVSSWGVDRLDVFVRGPGNTLWRKSYDGGTWSTWENLAGSPVTSSPAAVSWGVGRIDLFARGANNTLWHRWGNGTTWLP